MRICEPVEAGGGYGKKGMKEIDAFRECGKLPWKDRKGRERAH